MIGVESLIFSYGNRRVIDGVSFTVSGGTIAAVLGPNGAGKSTLLDLCLGWRRPQSGGIYISGKAVHEMGARERGRYISLVPQRENVRFDFPVLEYVLLGRSPHLPPLGVPGHVDREIAQDSLAQVGMENLADRSITELSGGEYQLMLIARSLAQQTDVLLLDEPTSQLDPAHRIDVLRVLRRLAAGGMSLLFTSHSPETAALVADEIHLLFSGKIVHSGKPEKVLTEENLHSAYGVPFRIHWIDGVPHVSVSL